ncbi:MAG: aspartate aminotransferase family protein [Acetobacteraceae bacterium]
MSRILQRDLRTASDTALSGDGIRLHLASGKTVIDGSGGAAVACLGHGNQRVAAAMAAQAGRMAYAHTGFFTSEPAEALADTLLAHEPGGLTHAFFVSSGSEAMEAALKLARQYFIETGQPRRTHVIARRQSYHGNTLGALAAGGHAMRRAHFEPMLSPTFSHVSQCFAYHHQAPDESDAQYVRRLADELEAEFQRLGPDTVAAFCAEPVVGAATGCVAAVPGYFAAIRAVCDRHGALLILDEVMCGMGRTGTMHAWEQEAIVPDIQTVAKGLGGGYAPIGGILVAGRVIDAVRAGSGGFVHGQTYQAHPVACAAALEVQRILAEGDLVANVAAQGAALERLLTERFGNHRQVGDIRGRGLFWALEFVSDRATRVPIDPASAIAERVKQAALDRGLAIYPCSGTLNGSSGDHIIIAPPYIVGESDLQDIVDRLGAAIDRVFSQFTTSGAGRLARA